MTTKMRIFSSLALTAATLFVVPLSSEEASAGGGHGGGGMRSFSVVRTSPVVISRARTTSVSTVRKQTVSQTKLKKLPGRRHAEEQAGCRQAEGQARRQAEEQTGRQAESQANRTPSHSV